MKNKNKLNALTKNYFKIPIKIVDIGLSPQALAIFCFMAKQSEEFDPAVSVMAKKLNMAKGTVIKYIKELESRNIIKCYHRGSGGLPGVSISNKLSKYEFIPSGEWNNGPKV